MSGTKRRMPTKSNIVDFWSALIDERFNHYKRFQCFACGYDVAVERAHIIPKWNGGLDEPENIHLLCRWCHFASESIVTENDYWDWFDSRTLFDTATMMQAAMGHKRTLTLSKELLGTKE